MSNRKEKISAFLDDDLHRDELMSFSLSAESDDAEVAQRYQMVGDALRGEMSESSFIDVSHAVREALADENIADEISVAATSAAAGTTARKEKQISSGFNWSSWFRPVAGMAVAASVAVVMVTSLSEQGGENTAPIAENNVQQPIIQQPAVQLAADKKINKSIGNRAIDLDPYLNQHLEFATQDTLQGRLPYVRAVSFVPNADATSESENIESKPSDSESTQSEKTDK